MKKKDLIKRILELGKELKKANGFDAAMIINDMEIEVDNYTKQLYKHDVSGSYLDHKTPIASWTGLKDCSLRLFNNIGNIKQIKDGQLQEVKYVEDITRDNFTKTEGLGIKSWREFVELRGY